MIVDSFKKIKQVLIIILFANIAVALAKIIIGLMIKSSSMTADGFHSLTDGSNNVVGLIAISFAAKPVDEDHPYGHRKYETLAGLAIAAMLVFIGLKIFGDAISRFKNPVVPSITLLSLVTLVITLCINLFVSTYEYKQGKKLDSQILISDSVHTKSDIFVSLGVLVSLLAIKLGAPPIVDPIVSIVVGIIILFSAWEVFKSASEVLVDKVVVDIDSIHKIAKEYPEILDIHKIRSRGTKNEPFVDLHIMTDPKMSVEDSHRLMHEFEAKLRENLCSNVELIVHIEPFNDEKEEIY